MTWFVKLLYNSLQGSVLRSVIAFIILSIFSGNLYANKVTPDHIVQIKQTSTTGKTIILDKGSNHSFKENDLGILFKIEINSKTKKKLYKPVAKLKAVKVFGENSIWISYKTFIPGAINKDARLLFLEESVLLEGRSDFKISRSKIVSRKNNLAKDVKNSLVEDEKELSTKLKNYNEKKILHEKEKHFDSDFNLVDLDIWEDKAGDKKLSPVAFYKSPYAKEFTKELRVQTFEKMVVSFMKKFNDPNFTLKELYYSRKNKDVNGEYVGQSTGGNYYERYLENEAKIKEKEEKIYTDLRNKGESWSDDYSDEELSELVYNIGAIKERERRKVIAAHKFDHQVYANFGLNLINNENLEDRENTAQSKYDFEFGWEYFLFKDVDSLKRFSTEFSFRRAVDAYSIGNGYNATSTEYSFGAHLNWYPFHLSNSLETNILYFGVFIRSGFAFLAVSEDNETGNYQVLTFPGFRAGIKYNFSNSYGVRLNATLENITSSRIVREFDNGILPDTANYTDGKISFGLSRFF